MEDTSICTRTFTVKCNKVHNVDLKQLYNDVELTPYIKLTSKKSQKMLEGLNHINSIADYSVISAKYGYGSKGYVKPTCRKKKVNPSKRFNNTTTLAVYTKRSNISVKVYQVGTLHITGVKEIEQVMKVIELVDRLIGNVYEKIYIIPCMTSIKFKVPFKLLRYNLIEYMDKEHPEYNNYVTSPDYNGIPFEHHVNRDKEVIEVTLNHGMVIRTRSMQSSHPLITPIYKETLNKSKSITFLVFVSGQIILCTPYNSFIEKDIETFRNVLFANKNSIGV